MCGWCAGDLCHWSGRKNSNNTNYQFWEQDNYPIEVDTNNLQEQKLEYIHNNSVEAGIVDNPAEYVYSSARSYEGRDGLIEIEFLE